MDQKNIAGALFSLFIMVAGAKMALAQATTTPTPAPPPGAPSTGAGGDAAGNLILLGSSALAAGISAFYLSRKRTELREEEKTSR